MQSTPTPTEAVRAARTQLLAHRRWTATALAVPLLCGCGATVRTAQSAACVPDCERTQSCGELDGQLLAARRPLLACVGAEARRGHLSSAHRCYRSLRMIESARWWLSSLAGDDEVGTVYQPSDTVRLEFLCRIEQLARARSAVEVERLYLDTIRWYP